MNNLTKEYNDFMKWFEAKHPELHAKYARNISIPFKEDGGVSVSNSFKISDDEYNMLFKVVQTYYEPK